MHVSAGCFCCWACADKHQRVGNRLCHAGATALPQPLLLFTTLCPCTATATWFRTCMYTCRAPPRLKRYTGCSPAVAPVPVPLQCCPEPQRLRRPALLRHCPRSLPCARRLPLPPTCDCVHGPAGASTAGPLLNCPYISLYAVNCSWCMTASAVGNYSVPCARCLAPHLCLFLSNAALNRSVCSASSASVRARSEGSSALI